MIEGCGSLADMNVLQREDLQRLTVEFVGRFLNRPWLRTDVMTGFQNRFQEDGETGVAADVDFRSLIAENDDSVTDYLCFLLLDLSTCDPELDESALAAARLFADETGLTNRFRELAQRELKIGKRTLARVWKDAAEIVQQAESEYVA